MKKNKYQLLGKLIASVLIMGMAMACPVTVRAEEEDSSENQSVIYIYHSHIGNEEEGGSCFLQEKYHVHEGSSAEGGACYGTAVYHTHAGSRQGGGACYQSPVYHSHRGDIYSGGACYSPVYHTHSEECSISISSHELGCQVLSTSDAGYTDGEGHPFNYYQMSCGQTILGTNASHGHRTLSCDRAGTIVGYQQSCSKSSSVIDEYRLSCTKSEGQTIEYYQFDCPLTEETLIGYEKSCGKEADQIVGKVTITEQRGEHNDHVELKAEFEDLSDGTLELADSGYAWKDESGNALGTGDNIRISENGTYQLEVLVASEDVDKNRLQGEVSVDGIVKPTPTPQQETSGGNEAEHSGGTDRENQENGLEESGSSTEGDSEENGSGDLDENTQENTDSTEEPGDLSNSSEPSAAENAVPTPSITPSMTEGDLNGANGSGDHGGNENSSAGSRKIRETAADRITVPTTAPRLVKETVVKRVDTVMSEAVEELNTDEIMQKETKSRFKRFLELPAVKVISVAASTLLLLLLTGFLLYYLRRSVRVYNDNGDGKKMYLGRCFVKILEEGYAIEITDAMVERAVTNRYRIRPGLFCLFRKEEELLVCRKKRKIAVPMDKEMIVVI